jgi:isoleucyl-tRNA synthetase
MKRVPEVIDCWFDSGAMPFAQAHFPFACAQSQISNLKTQKLPLPELFPADYICEAIDQTRGWFYTLLVISTLLGKGAPYRNILCLGHILDEKGEKMSKSKGNIVDPWKVIEKYGADTLRWYFFTINNPGNSKRFVEKDLKKSFNKFILTLWNSYVFYKTYAEPRGTIRGTTRKNISVNPRLNPRLSASNLLDKWIISQLQTLNEFVEKSLDKFDILSAAREIEKFTLDDLSNWYIRRSRRRFQQPKNQKDFKEASKTLGYVLLELSKLSAPFIPFLSETIYQSLTTRNHAKLYAESRGNNSVHLEIFPKINKTLRDKNLEEQMQKAREIVVMGLAERKKAGIKVRQPLQEFKIKNLKFKIDDELLNLIKDELNVKEVKIEKSKGELKVELDTKITPELKKEGLLREILHQIQEMRKSGNLKGKDRIKIIYDAPKELTNLIKENEKLIKETTIAKKISQIKKPPYLVEKQINLDGQEIQLAIKKV